MSWEQFVMPVIAIALWQVPSMGNWNLLSQENVTYDNILEVCGMEQYPMDTINRSYGQILHLEGIEQIKERDVIIQQSKPPTDWFENIRIFETKEQDILKVNA